MFKFDISKHRHTATNFFWRNLQIFSKGGFYTIVFFIAARTISPDDFGLFNFYMALISFLMIFCDFGISAATSRFTAEYTQTSPEKLPRVMFSAFIPVIAVASLISLLIYISGTFFFKSYRMLLIFIPYVFLVPLTSIVDGYLRGIKQFKKLALAYLVSGILATALAFPLVSTMGLKGAILSFTSIYVFFLIILLPTILRLSYHPDTETLKKITKYAYLIGLMSIFYFMYSQVDIIILKQFNFVPEIGYYSIILKIFNIFLLPAMIFGHVIAPDISKHISNGNISAVKDKFRKYILTTLSIALPLSVVIFLSLPFAIKTFLPQYDTGIFMAIFKILLFLFPLKLWGVILIHGLITPTGRIKISTILTCIGGILNIVLDYVTIKVMGFIGVFWTTLIVHSCVILITTVIFYRQLNSSSLSEINTLKTKGS